jgi:hypothetical protein
MFFTSKHLDEMNMNYFEHMLVSLNYALILFIYSIKAFIHAFIPDVFTTSTSECINEINIKFNHHNNNYYNQ